MSVEFLLGAVLIIFTLTLAVIAVVSILVIGREVSANRTKLDTNLLSLSRIEMLFAHTLPTINKIEGIIASVDQLENAVSMMSQAAGTLVDTISAGAMGMPPNSREIGIRRGKGFFSTTEGDIQAPTFDEFMDKLKESPKYKDIADDIRQQLEDEMQAEDEDEENDKYPF